MEKKILLLDTNFLLIPGQFNVDIFSEFERVCDFSYQLTILQGSVDELHHLVKQGLKQKDKRAAKLGLQLLNKVGVAIVEGDALLGVDNQIVAYAGEHEAVVATQDQRLRHKLKKRGVKMVVLRQEKYLQLY